MKELTKHELNLITEKSEVIDRIEDLASFIDDKEEFDKVSASEQSLIIRQLLHQINYLGILTERIVIIMFGKDIDNLSCNIKKHEWTKNNVNKKISEKTISVVKKINSIHNVRNRIVGAAGGH